MLELSDASLVVIEHPVWRILKTIYLVMLHDVAANEKLDDSEDAGLEDDEDVDG